MSLLEQNGAFGNGSSSVLHPLGSSPEGSPHYSRCAVCGTLLAHDMCFFLPLCLLVSFLSLKDGGYAVQWKERGSKSSCIRATSPPLCTMRVITSEHRWLRC